MRFKALRVVYAVKDQSPANHRVWLAPPSSLLEVLLIPRDACPSSFTGAQLLRFGLHQTPHWNKEVCRSLPAGQEFSLPSPQRYYGSSAGTETWGFCLARLHFQRWIYNSDGGRLQAFAGVSPFAPSFEGPSYIRACLTCVGLPGTCSR